VTVLYNSSFDLPKRRHSVLPPLMGAAMVACGTPSSIPPAKTGCQICMVVLEATPERSHGHSSQFPNASRLILIPLHLIFSSPRPFDRSMQKSKPLPELKKIGFVSEKLLFN
jgi:hypothetical protein